MHRLQGRQRRLDVRLPECPACGLACRNDGEWVPARRLQPALQDHAPTQILCPDYERKHYDMQSG
ncbi:MAG: hypothetical protein WC205_07025 [Opitutaceae bacterium]